MHSIAVTRAVGTRAGFERKENINMQRQTLDASSVSLRILISLEIQ